MRAGFNTLYSIIVLLGLYSIVGNLVIAVRHPELTDTQRFIHLLHGDLD
jgi:hypothetical protein